jgi:hypothetical protein
MAKANATESILGYPEPQHWPTPMSRFGLNPHGDNLWRIVFAPSVKRMVGGLWPDGAVEYRLRPKYRDLGPVWVLEKWISAIEDSHMTESRYNLNYLDVSTGLLLCGPYPHKGVYQHTHTFDPVAPGDCNLEFLIGAITKAKYNDPVKVKEAVEEHYQKQQAEADANHMLAIKESYPAFGLRPTNFAGHVHSFKSHRFDTPSGLLRRRGLPRNKAVTGVTLPTR